MSRSSTLWAIVLFLCLLHGLDHRLRLTLANDKNKNKTENCFLFLFKRHRTALAISAEQKVDSSIEQA